MKLKLSELPLGCLFKKQSGLYLLSVHNNKAYPTLAVYDLTSQFLEVVLMDKDYEVERVEHFSSKDPKKALALAVLLDEEKSFFPFVDLLMEEGLADLMLSRRIESLRHAVDLLVKHLMKVSGDKQVTKFILSEVEHLLED